MLIIKEWWELLTTTPKLCAYTEGSSHDLGGFLGAFFFLTILTVLTVYIREEAIKASWFVLGENDLESFTDVWQQSKLPNCWTEEILLWYCM
jgi:hypothetical protein